MSAGADVQAVVLGLGEEVFALPVTFVREILDQRDAFRVPHGPEWLMGLIDVRGQSVPMVDLRVRFGFSATVATVATRVLVVEVPHGGSTLTLGLVVDSVIEVRDFAAGEIEPAPEIGVRWRSEYIMGVGRRGADFVVLLDLPAIFAGADLGLMVECDRAA